MSFDRLQGKQLDAVATIQGVRRERVRRWWLLGLRTRETDAELRQRIKLVWDHRYRGIQAVSLFLRFIRWLATKLPRRDIVGEDGVLYLTRYRIFGWMPGSRWKGPSLYLHRFHIPDQDLAPHNHPWRWAVSWVLTGGYTEERLVPSLHPYASYIESRDLMPGRMNIIQHSDYHRVARLHGETWTLFLVGPKATSWGFYVMGRGHVEWRERLRERGIKPAY